MQVLLHAVMLLISGQAGIQTVVEQAATLPPRPDQALISCHDGTWEASHLTNAGAVKVHTKLQPYVDALVRDARQQGLIFTINSGYRTCEQQQLLRLQACGGGEYNLYRRPIAECLPPTEPAGNSLHNEGLAIDVGCSGWGFFETSPCYSWLKQHAGRYQLQEHELEPWHWSTTGK